MKRLMKLVVSFALIVALLFSVSVTAYAATDVREERICIGDDKSLPFSDVPYVSSDTSVIEIRQNGRSDYTAVAVGVGEAEVTGGVWMREPQEDFHFTVYRTEFGKEIGDMADDMGAFFYVFLIVLLLFVAMIVYIFIEAPKCGMSRWWALVPIFSNVLGIIIFIVVRSRSKTGGKTSKITCPTCGGVHSGDTTFCPICGTKLQ